MSGIAYDVPRAISGIDASLDMWVSTREHYLAMYRRSHPDDEFTNHVLILQCETIIAAIKAMRDTARNLGAIHSVTLELEQ